MNKFRFRLNGLKIGTRKFISVALIGTLLVCNVTVTSSFASTPLSESPPEKPPGVPTSQWEQIAQAAEDHIDLMNTLSAGVEPVNAGSIAPAGAGESDLVPQDPVRVAEPPIEVPMMLKKRKEHV